MLGAIGALTGNAAGLVGNAVRTVSSIVKAPFSSDSSNVSSEGLLLSSLSGETASQIIGGGSRMNGAQLQKMLQEKAVSLQKKLATICKQNNISTNDTFTLNVDKDGKIVIKGDHSQKDKLEKLLNSDGDFVREFKDAKTLSDFVTKFKSSKN